MVITIYSDIHMHMNKNIKYGDICFNTQKTHPMQYRDIYTYTQTPKLPHTHYIGIKKEKHILICAVLEFTQRHGTRN